jgi:putative transposase
MDVFEARRLRQLEEANARLKKPLADAMPDNAALKNIASKINRPPLAASGSRSLARAGLPGGKFGLRSVRTK